MTKTIIRQPNTFVFAGPNGSGKSSLIAQIKKNGVASKHSNIPFPSLIINPDQVAQNLPGPFANQVERDRAAFDEVRQIRRDVMESKCSFGFETVMSHPSRINEMRLLKQLGFTLILFFITTDHPDKNVARVALRVKTKSTTGHDVPERKVRERYERTLALLPKAVELADIVLIYDNSIDYQDFELQVTIEGEALFEVAKEHKPWVAQRLLLPLKERSDELDQISALMNAQGKSAALDADELAGQYQGPLIWQGKHFILQLDRQSQQAIIHDCAMLETTGDTLNFTGDISIIYTLENAPELTSCELASPLPSHTNMAPDEPDLGFGYRIRKSGEVDILHRGQVASTLRGADAADFLAEVAGGDEASAQQLMARVTGNYKRGNERQASLHPRNRR
jgi:predicted ABC-type ATPase